MEALVTDAMGKMDRVDWHWSSFLLTLRFRGWFLGILSGFERDVRHVSQFQGSLGPVQLLGEKPFVGQSESVLGRHDLVGQSSSASGRPARPSGEQDQSHGWVLAFVRPVLLGIVQVKVHLPRVGVGELADLQVDDDQAAQAAVEEEQVDPIPLVADPQTLLTPDEGEVAAEFEQEVFELPDQGVFQVVLG